MTSISRAAEAERRRCWLFQRLAMTLDRLKRWADADAIRADARTAKLQLAGGSGRSPSQWHDDLDRGEQPRPWSGSRCYAPHSSAVKSQRASRAGGASALAGGYVRLRTDAAAARRVLEGVEQPSLVSDATHVAG